MFRAIIQRVLNPAESARLEQQYLIARRLMEQEKNQASLLQAKAMFQEILDKTPGCEGAYRNIIKIEMKLEKQQTGNAPKQ
jgi:hypothetical protein